MFEIVVGSEHKASVYLKHMLILKCVGKKINTPGPPLMVRLNQIDHILIDRRWYSYYMYEVSGELIVILITIWWLQKLGEDWQ